MWFLNRWLTSWRTKINGVFSKRSKKSDGTIGDLRHQASFSEHNRDWDGSVDAWDMDVNVYASGNEQGSKDELAEIENLKREFQNDPGSQLWIHNGYIANRDIGNWTRRRYYGANQHDKHVHWQSRSSKENTAFAGNIDDVVDAVNAPEMKPVSRTESTKVSAPKWPMSASAYFSATDRARYSVTVKAWQAQMRKRGWKISADGYFGPRSADILRQFQKEKKLKVDGKLGPKSFAAAWTAKVT